MARSDRQGKSHKWLYVGLATLFVSALVYSLYLSANQMANHPSTPNIPSSVISNQLLADEIYRNMANPSLPGNKTELLSTTMQMFKDLGYDGKIMVLGDDGNYTEQALSVPTIQAFCNYSYAVNGLNLLPFARATLMMAGNMSQRNPIIFDFEPIAAGAHTYWSANIPRDVWGILNLIAERPTLVEQPKKYEWANRMVQQLMFDIIDNDFGVKFYDKATYKVSDAAVWSVIFPFYDYMDALPAKMERAGIGVVVPYHNSDLLRQQLPDNASRAMTLFYLADIPPQAHLSDTQIVSGIEGMRAFVKGLDAKLQTMLNLYPNGTIDTQYMGPKSPKYWFDPQWIEDRAGHALPNTMKEMKSIDQSLSKSWKYWNLVKFAFGYGRGWHSGEDWEGMFYNIPHTFKALGIPFVHCGHYFHDNINGDEWGVAGLPEDVVNSLKQAYPDVAIGYGNVFGALLCKNGCRADLSLGTKKGGATSISSYQQFRGAYPSISPYGRYLGDSKGKIAL